MIAMHTTTIPRKNPYKNRFHRYTFGRRQPPSRPQRIRDSPRQNPGAVPMPCTHLCTLHRAHVDQQWAPQQRETGRVRSTVGKVGLVHCGGSGHRPVCLERNLRLPTVLRYLHIIIITLHNLNRYPSLLFQGRCGSEL
jgi:hypothetical protein